ncbi:MAG TPA: glycosyl transferase, partial [Roseiflexaceae bacterium]|nr:glycosyl transferase [Roseiflexaceae bacterium]
MASATASRFARTFAGNIGVDPYTMAVSDVYMDLFGEGIYAGKGIYDPQVLRETLHGRFPENALLSHDLIEGNYARAGLLSDIELLDGYPTTYAAYAARQHRWVRGDWQIARWLLPRVPDGSGKLVPNVLSPLARYKIFDNLRRSLVPPAIVTLLGAGWLALPGRPAVWTALALSSYAAPLAFSVIDTLLGVRTLRALRALPEALRNLRLDALRALLNMALLPDQAVLNVDAIVRTLARLGYSRRNLLEWETAAQSGRRLTNSEGYLRRSSFPAIAAAALGSALRPEHAGAAWQAATPVLASWAAAPSLAGWLDQPYLAEREPEPGPHDRVLLRSIARATYTYFERFVNEEGSFLAPDNFQETPNPVVAFRTSPTNIGLQLLADLSAFDFGYLGVYDLLERIERVFSTMEQLERYRGHLFNWYDTESLRPLNPRYVSTVDSGNLAGSLLALRQGLLALHERPVAGEWVRHGLLDLVELIDGRVTSDDHGREVAT